MNRFAYPIASKHRDHPVRALPGLLGQLVHDLAATGVDCAIVALQLLAFISVLTQGVADVLWSNGQRAPVGSNGLLIASSGSGKSVIFKMLMEPIAWFLNRSISSTGTDSRHRPAFFLEDATRAAVIHHLSVWPVVGLFSDEAGQLKQLLQNAAPTLAKLLDGAPLRHARISTGRIELLDHRLTMLLMEQPQVFESSKVLVGASKGGVGLINRFFVATAKGSPAGAAIHRIGLSESVASRYKLRVNDLLERSIRQVKSKEERPALRLAPDAETYFIGLNDEIRQMQGKDSRLSMIAEYAVRHSERVLGLAGAIHAFEHGTEGEIQLATVCAADELGRWSLEEFALLTYEAPKPTQVEQDALTLERALRGTATASATSAFPLSDVRRWAVNIGLTKPRFDRAVPLLAMQGKITIIPNGRTDWLRVNPPWQGLFAN